MPSPKLEPVSYPEPGEFEVFISSAFAFLETCGIASFRGLAPPIDHHLEPRYRATYAGAAIRFEISLWPQQHECVVEIDFDRPGLSKSEAGFLLEHFLYYVSYGAIRPIMTRWGLPKTRGDMQARHRELLAAGVDGVVRALADRLRDHLDEVVGVSDATLCRYARWDKTTEGLAAANS